MIGNVKLDLFLVFSIFILMHCVNIYNWFRFIVTDQSVFLYKNKDECECLQNNSFTKHHTRVFQKRNCLFSEISILHRLLLGVDVNLPDTLKSINQPTSNLNINKQQNQQVSGFNSGLTST